MTEIQEMAQAIHEKHKALWPLTWAVADFMAKQLAGDQGYPIVNQLTHALMGLNTKQTEPVEPAPAQDEREAVVVVGYAYNLESGAYSQYPGEDWSALMTVAQHERIVAALTRPAQTEQQPIAKLGLRDLFPTAHWSEPEHSFMWMISPDEQRALPKRDLLLYAAPIAQTAPQVPPRMEMEPYQTVDRRSTNYKAGWNACRKVMLEGQTALQLEQNDSPNMEPEGANAYLVVDPDDNYHICYVVRSKDQALQHASGGLLAFGPIT